MKAKYYTDNETECLYRISKTGDIEIYEISMDDNKNITYKWESQSCYSLEHLEECTIDNLLEIVITEKYRDGLIKLQKKDLYEDILK